MPEASVAVPSGTVPSKKETEPVGVSAAPLTATVKVTLAPKAAGLGDAVRRAVVAAGAGFTVTWAGGADTEGASSEEPP